MMPALNKMIQGQTGQQNDVVLNPAPRDVLKIVEAIGSSGLCKIGVTCQDAVEYDEDGRMQTLGRLDLSRPSVYDSDTMYNSLVYRRRPGGRKLDGIVLAVCTTLDELNWAEDALSKGAHGSVNANGGGGGSHQLDQFIDGVSTKLGIVYLMVPIAETIQEYVEHCKAKMEHFKGIAIEVDEKGRKVSKAQDTSVRKVQDTSVRKVSKVQDTSVRKVQDTSVRKVGSGLSRCPLCDKGCSRYHNKGQEDKKTGCNGFGMSVEEVRDAKRMRLSLPEEEED